MASERTQFAPVRHGLGQEALADVVGAILERFVRTQDEGHGVVDEERILLEDRGDGCVAGEPEHEAVPDVANVVAAGGRAGQRLAVVLRRPRAHANAGVSRDALHAPHQHHRTEDPAVVLEARCEISDFDSAAGGVGQARDHHWCVLQVALLGRGTVEQLDGEESDVVRPPARGAGGLEQGAEHGIAIEARETGPRDLARGIDERADRPVPDEC